MPKKKRRNRKYNFSDISAIICIIVFIACVIGDIAVSIWLMRNVKDYWAMGTSDGYSLFELRILWTKAPKAMAVQTIFSAGAFASVIGLIINRNRY